jgi:hypothetical protein
MSANRLSIPRSAVIVAAVLCATLTGAAVYSVLQARGNEDKLLQAELELDQLKQSQSKNPGADAAMLRKLLDEKDAAYIELEDKYRQLSQQAPTRPVAAAGTIPDTAMPGRAARGSGSNTNRVAWMDRLRQQDPERYQQMVTAREQRRQQADQAYQDQMTQLDQRAQTAATPDEAELATKIADTLDQINQLRDSWRAVRDLPEDQRQAQVEQLATQSRQAYQTLSDLRDQDRSMQLQNLATQLGLQGQNAQSLVEGVPQIYKSTQYNPQGGRGFGGPGGRDGAGGTPANTGSSSTTTTTTPQSSTTR